MRVIKVCCNKSKVDNSRLKYSIQFLNNHPLKNKGYTFQLEPKEIKGHFSIGIQEENRDCLIPNGGNVFQKGNNGYKPILSSFRFNESMVYGLSSRGKEESVFYENSTFSFDIFETIFFFISRYEEYYAHDTQLDQYGRMKSSEQLIVKTNLHQKPIVDQLVFAFFSVLGIENRLKTSYTMSTDVDVILKYPNSYRFIRNLGRALITNRSITKFYKTISQYLKCAWFGDKDPYDTFDWLLSSQKGFEKDIYFMSGGLTKEDNLYKIEDAKHVLDESIIQGYNVGIHPSFDCVNNSSQLKKEVKLLALVLDKPIKNSRQHFLKFNFKKTINDLESLGIKNDSTLGFQDEIGFRCGTGFSYYLYDFVNEKQSEILEKPLIIMDGPLVFKVRSVAEVKDKLFDFLERNKYNTHITFNFHNSSFDDVYIDALAFKNLYIDLIKYMSK